MVTGSESYGKVKVGSYGCMVVLMLGKSFIVVVMVKMMMMMILLTRMVGYGNEGSRLIRTKIGW